ncbi:HIT family protein [Thiohalorhabdus sp. Cl-TMA]|uniref:HIT family protein n=1 Tax=Thiohalorhabdus methylotrophus TaxID=3242694 RepID=A0ABV4TVL5_9GAMM
MATIFTKIINGEIPAEKLTEDERFLAFLDVRPIRPGHTLVVTKQETDYIFDLDDETLGGLLPFAKQLTGPIQRATGCTRVGVMVAGLEVPHCHVHLVPMDRISDLDFGKAAEVPANELADMAGKIRAEM